MTELYCTLCQRLVVVDDMILIKTFRGGRGGKGPKKIFLEPGVKGLAHIVLGLQASQAFKPKVVVVKTIVQKKPVVTEGAEDVNSTNIQEL